MAENVYLGIHDTCPFVSRTLHRVSSRSKLVSVAPLGDESFASTIRARPRS